MEGRGYSDFYRNSSEEIFLKSLMENSMGMPAPTMEMLGFKNLSQSFRADSEELFNSWLTNGENNGHNSASIAHRTRLASRRISTELAAFSTQQHGITPQTKSGNDIFTPNLPMVEEIPSEHNQHQLRNAVEKGMQASNLYLAKAWFHSSQPMTRSRSSELRKRYAAQQNIQTSIGVEGAGINRTKQDFATTSNFCEASIGEIPNQMETFMSPSNSSTSPFNTPIDAVSSVVSMLKGALERKKVGTNVDTEFVFYNAQEVLPNTSTDQLMNDNCKPPFQLKDSKTLQMFNGAMEVDIEDFVDRTNMIQLSAVSQEPSQSESSAAPPILSTAFEVCDGPINSGQNPSVSESSRKQVGNGSLEHGSKTKDFRERIVEKSLKDERKKGGLARMGSVTSIGSVEKGDPTKKRRVERSRKMAEAKERNLTPAVPTDVQSILKRCENLEKEVRSLKLNLSFMNRKDSEQTKQIEDLQKQNEDLADEKERLLEEIERILSETGNM